MATPSDFLAFTQEELDFLQANTERCEYCGHQLVFHEQRGVDSYCQVDDCSWYICSPVWAEAAPGGHDDLVIALAGCLMLAEKARG